MALFISVVDVLSFFIIFKVTEKVTSLLPMGNAILNSMIHCNEKYQTPIRVTAHVRAVLRFGCAHIISVKLEEKILIQSKSSGHFNGSGGHFVTAIFNKR